MSEQDKDKEEKTPEDEIQDLDLDAEESAEITERVRGGRLAFS